MTSTPDELYAAEADTAGLDVIATAEHRDLVDKLYRELGFRVTRAGRRPRMSRP